MPPIESLIVCMSVSSLMIGSPVGPAFCSRASNMEQHCNGPCPGQQSTSAASPWRIRRNCSIFWSTSCSFAIARWRTSLASVDAYYKLQRLKEVRPDSCAGKTSCQQSTGRKRSLKPKASPGRDLFPKLSARPLPADQGSTKASNPRPAARGKAAENSKGLFCRVHDVCGVPRTTHSLRKLFVRNP